MKAVKFSMAKNKKTALIVMLLAITFILIALVVFRVALLNSNNNATDEPRQSNPILTDEEVIEQKKIIEQDGFFTGRIVSINKQAKQIILAERIYKETDPGDPDENSPIISDKTATFSYKTEPPVLKGISAENIGFDSLLAGSDVSIIYNTSDKTVKEVWLK